MRTSSRLLLSALAFSLLAPAALAQDEGGDRLDDADPAAPAEPPASDDKVEEEAPASDEGEATEGEVEEGKADETAPADDADKLGDDEPAADAPPADAPPADAPPADMPPAQEPTEPLPPEPKVGDIVGGWKLITVTGDKLLPDGRATEERCGYVREVVVEKGPRVERVRMQVPCVPSPAGLVPGLPRLAFPEPEPEPVAPEEPATPQTPAEPATTEPATTEPAPTEPAPAEPGGAQTADEHRQQGDARERGEPEEEKKPDEPKKPFLKGELTRFGDVQLLNRRTSFGVGLGATAIGGVYYGVVRPDLNLHFGPFSLGLGAPLRFQVVDTNKFVLTADPAAIPQAFEASLADAGRFRTEDWDQVEDFLRPLRYLSWGKKEDSLYIDINRVHALTIGHGQLMRRYSPTVDIDEDNLFAEVDGYMNFGGFELIAGPFPVPRIVGGLLFVKPLGLFLDDYISRSLSIGVSYLTDLNVPTQLTTVPNPADSRLQLPVDDAGNFLYTNQGAFVGDMVHGFGVDGEVKIVKWEFIDLKTYLDYSQLLLPGVPDAGIEPFTDLGFTGGLLLRMSFGAQAVNDLEDETPEVQANLALREMKAIHALRFRLEGRTFGPQYLPSFFDSLYEADKQQFGFGATEFGKRATLPTKIAYLATQAGEPWRAGFYAEASYQWVDWIGLTAMYEDAFSVAGDAVPAARNLALHAETGAALGFLQLFATYHYRHFEDFSKLFQFGTDNELFYFGGRLQVLPILFINVGAQRAFRTAFGEDDLPDQRRTLPNAAAGAMDYRFTSVGLANTWSWNLDVELGWQF